MKAIVLLLCIGFATALECTGDEVACGSGERCVPYRYICDSDSDCSDASDEDPDLCWAWNNSECERGSAQCLTNGRAECVPIETYCHRTQPACSGSLDRRVCSIIEDKKLVPLASIKFPPDNEPADAYNRSVSLGAELRTNLNNTLSHPDCPDFYTRVGDQCLSVFYVGRSSWGEARAFCKHIGGDLLSIQNANHYIDLVNHLSENQITSDFWLGGRYELDDLSWMWLDGTRMPRGTPFWSLRRYHHCDTRNVTVAGTSQVREANNGECYHYTQAPEDPPRGFCAAITYGKHFYMSDEDCLADMSPLCVTSV
ncbi:low-density lipoprotein receptor-related protein 2-like isoform X2 [Penaeus japonicus]|nr:low-density lipoprotein receptor-related protein 2-like isoform X2 [Penaeus japonicus]